MVILNRNGNSLQIKDRLPDYNALLKIQNELQRQIYTRQEKNNLDHELNKYQGQLLVQEDLLQKKISIATENAMKKTIAKDLETHYGLDNDLKSINKVLIKRR